MSYTPLGESSESSSIDFTRRSGRDSALASLGLRTASRQQNSALAEPLTEDIHDDEDPFYVFRNDLLKKLELVDEGLADFLRIIHETDTAVNSAELKNSKKQLKRHLKNAEATLKDVEVTVQLVENNRQKFNHINDNELYDRRSLVRTSRDRIDRAKDEMNSEAVKAKMLADERAKAIRRAGAESLGATNDEERGNTAFIIDSQARTSLLMQHQDETLDELDVAVTRVGRLAENIHEEIGQQNKILTEMEDDLATAEEELGIVMGKLAKFLQTKDRWQLGTIMALFATAVVLFLLVLYT